MLILICCSKHVLISRESSIFFARRSDLQQTVWAVLNALSMFMFLVLQICIAAYLLKFLYIVVHLQHSYHPPEKLMMHGILALSNAHLFLIFDFVAWFQLCAQYYYGITLEAWQDCSMFCHFPSVHATLILSNKHVSHFRWHYFKVRNSCPRPLHFIRILLLLASTIFYLHVVLFVTAFLYALNFWCIE